MAAKTKLAECQRTILALGKQLSTLSTSPPVDHSSSMGSFDGTGSSSMDSASQQLDRRSMHAEHMNTQSMGFMEEEEDEEHVPCPCLFCHRQWRSIYIVSGIDFDTKK